MRLVGGIGPRALQGFPNHLLLYKGSRHDLKVVRFLHEVRDLPRYLEPAP